VTATVPLGSVLTKSENWIEIDPLKRYTELTVHLWGRGVSARRVAEGSEIAGQRRLKVLSGEFVVSRIDARHGAFAVIPDHLNGAIVSNDFPTFRPNQDRLLPQYLGWLSRTHDFVKACRSASEGTTNRVRLKEETFASIEFPLPPLSEQRRIVAKIERVAAKIDDARGLSKYCVAEAEKLPASWAHHLFSQELVAIADSVPLGEIAEVQSGVTLGRQVRGPSVELPYLRVANVQDGFLDLGLVKTIAIYEDEKEKWLLKRGDILLTEGGDWDKLGRGTVWNGEIPNCIHQNHIFRVRIDQHAFDPRYIVALTSSPYGKEYFQGASKQTTNLASIKQRQLKAFPVYRLPIREQRRIVAYLDGLQAKVDRLKALQTQTRAELDALLPSILDRAFKGEL
jgi:type I restriction enzyme, S subunit